MPVEVQVSFGGGVADQHGGVDVGGQRRGLEDAHDVEPHVPGPDPLPGPDPVDAHPLRRGGAEHADGLAGGGGVEEPARASEVPAVLGGCRLVASTDSALVSTAGIFGDL